MHNSSWRDYFKWGTSPFWVFHGLALSALFLPFEAKHVWTAVGLYFFRMFFITGGYHRYFSHKTYSTSRFWQFWIAFFAMSSSQKGALWWAAHHRHHHAFSDQPQDLHSPKDGFWWSHMGWFLSDRYGKTELGLIADFAKYPELRWLDKNWWVPVATLGVALKIIGGWTMVNWGLCVSTVFLWHGTFTINSLSHVWGSRPFKTSDTSRNNFWLALITLGEGWHNNHHQFPRVTRNGFHWWQIDITYYVLKGMETVGLVWDLKHPPASAMEQRPLQKAS